MLPGDPAENRRPHAIRYRLDRLGARSELETRQGFPVGSSVRCQLIDRKLHAKSEYLPGDVFVTTGDTRHQKKESKNVHIASNRLQSLKKRASTCLHAILPPIRFSVN